jgi:hypothetical protein
LLLHQASGWLSPKKLLKTDLKLADRFLEGRHRENPGQLVQKYGHEEVSAAPPDITNLDGIPTSPLTPQTDTKT